MFILQFFKVGLGQPFFQKGKEMKWFIILTLLVIGCGDDKSQTTDTVPGSVTNEPEEIKEPEVKSPLLGQWMQFKSDVCIEGFYFDETTFDYVLGCFESQVKGHFETWSGTYTYTDSQFILTVTNTSCPDRDRVMDFDYQVNETQLLIDFGNAVSTFPKVENEDDGNNTGLNIELGCWINGEFTS